MTATPPRLPRETVRESTARGWWSAGLALGSPVIYGGGGFIAILALAPFGSWADPSYLAALAVAWIVLIAIAVAMVTAALYFGITSIARARRTGGPPGRGLAILLGCIGIGVSALMGVLLISHVNSLISSSWL